MGEKELATEVRRIFDYDPSTEHLKNLVRRGNNSKIGARPGCLKQAGYRHIEIEGKRYMEHRVIWLWVYGRWPMPEVDHINRVRDDNRISNLRQVTRIENMKNVPPRKRGPNSPYPNVRTCGNRHYAYAHSGGAQIHLGSFSSAEQASAAHVAYMAQRGAT